MSQRPLFSVVIPTKNRGFLAKDALQSVLRQTCPDWEALLVDNDDTSATREAVDSIRDPRIRYIRTGGLCMPDNWETGCAQARGEYLCIIEDKQALHRDALACLEQIVRSRQPACVHWLTDIVDDTASVTFLNPAEGSGRTEELSSDHVLDLFCRQGVESSNRYMPLGHFCALHRSLVDQIKSGPAGRLCPPMSPDYTMAFLILNYAQTLIHVDRALVVGSRRNSNGRDCNVRRQAAINYFNDIGRTEADAYDLTPLKILSTANVICNDFLHIRQLVQGRLARHDINPAALFVECRGSIDSLHGQGYDQRPEMRAWRQALQLQPPAVRDQILQRLAQERPLWLQALHRTLKRWRSLTGLRSLETSLKIKSRQWRGRLHANQFKTSLDYADWAAESRRPAPCQAPVDKPTGRGSIR